jgi:sterol 3beta-glucosyltransferase
MPEPDAGTAAVAPTPARAGRRVLIVTAGGGGDVAPYTGLGARLRDAGFDVAIATHAPYEPMVTASGITFRPLPGDPKAWLRSASGESDDDGGTAAVFGQIHEAQQDTAAAIAAAAQAGADVMLLSALSVPIGYQVAEAFGVPSMGVHLAPIDPTREFSSIFVPGSFGRWGNLASHKVIGAAFNAWLSGGVKKARADLGLPPLSLGAMQKRMRREAWPTHYGYSEAVIPRPADWRPGIEVVGYWWPDQPGAWSPPPGLADFLAAGPPPVFVTFGSLGTEGQRLSELVPAALRRAGVRGVIQAGWGDLAASGDDMLTIGEAPHDRLFPQMAAVVHAAGAGTVATGLRAGVPAVSVPMGIDQPMWGQRLVALGAAPDSIPAKKLTVERLAAAVQAAVSDPRHRRAAAALGERIAAEDGAGATVATVCAILGVPAPAPVEGGVSEAARA